MYVINLLHMHFVPICYKLKVCNPHQIAKQKECLIYSVGSNGKAEFEKAVKEEIGEHCEIHSE